MFALGHIHFKHHVLWVTTPVFTLKSYMQMADNLSYYEVLLTKKDLPIDDNELSFSSLYNFYVDIMAHPVFKGVMQVNERNLPIQDVTDMIQYQSYMDRKGMSQPLYKLSKKSVDALLVMLQTME